MDRPELIQDIKVFMLAELKLRRTPDEVKSDAPLFGPDGLGIDSLDALQLGLAAEERYGVKIPLDTDPKLAEQALASVEALADFVIRAKAT